MRWLLRQTAQRDPGDSHGGAVRIAANLRGDRDVDLKKAGCLTVRLFAAVLATFSCHALAAADLYDAINRLRAGRGACAAVQKPAALTRHPALERAASELARGQTLPDSVKASGYRAAKSLFISITGDSLGEDAVALLEKRYCRQLLGAELADIGIYQDARHAWIVMAAPFAPQVALSPEAAARRVLDLVNKARAVSRRCGDKSFDAARHLRWSAVLANVSREHAEDMAHFNYFSHRGRDGSTPAERVLRMGYKFRVTGENIAAGQSTPDDAVAGWIKSPPHCANLMNPAYTEMGVAFAVDRNSELGVYWTQEFGVPR
jgi:uncharacterized protein YkwD